MEDAQTMDLRKFWEILKSRLRLILLITFICTAVSGILSYFVLPPVYEANTSIIVGKAPDQHSLTNESSNVDDIYMYQKLIKTYASIAKSNLVSDKTAELLDNGVTGDEIQKETIVTPETDTQILDIKCESKDPAEAQKMVNILAAIFIEESQKIYPTDNIKIMDTAKLPAEPVKPKKIINMAVAFIAGLMGAIGIAYMLACMDNTIKTEEDVENFLELPVLGIIPQNMEKA